jgi:Prephenate dehydrogenase
MRQIAIIGVGFIGGCLASSIKKLKICDRLVGIEQSPENCEYILKKGLVDEIVEEVPEDTELILIALPNDQVAEWVCKLANHKALILDVASVKAEILKLG